MPIQEARGRNLYSGSVSRFPDLCRPEQFQGASCLSVLFRHVSFPRSACGQWRKSTWKPCRQSLNTKKNTKKQWHSGVWGGLEVGGEVFPLFGSEQRVAVYLNARRKTCICGAAAMAQCTATSTFYIPLLFMRRGSQAVEQPSINKALSPLNRHSLLKMRANLSHWKPAQSSTADCCSVIKMTTFGG